MAGTQPSFFLFGGSFLHRLAPYLAESAGAVAGQYIGPSPLSTQAVLPGTGALGNWRDDLDPALADASADWLVLDIQRAEAMLYAAAESRITPPPDGDTACLPQGAVPMSPYDMPKRDCEQALRSLAELLLRHFPAERIILLHTHRPDFWIAGEKPRETDSPVVRYTAVQKKWLADLEQAFCCFSGCRYLDISRFYFWRKEPGRPLTEVIYEEECYLDTARCIRAAAAGEEMPQRPAFAFSLRRYIRYQPTLFRKCFTVFLNSARLPEKLVLSSSPAFAAQYTDSLLRLDELCLQETGSVPELPDTEFARIVRAFAAVCRGQYTGCPAEDYAAMFRAGVVPDEILKKLKARAKDFGVSPLQINRWNAGLYFARMLGRDEQDFITEDTVERPVPVDIFGSCVSRTGFNIRENDTAVGHYWFHVPPFEHRNPKLRRPLPALLGKFRWSDRLVRQQFAHQIYRDIRRSDAEWLVVDMYCLAAPDMYRYRGVIYTDFLGKISRQLGAEKVTPHRDSSVLGSHEDILHLLGPWCETVRQKFGDRIILLNALRSDCWLGDDRMIYRYPRPMDQNGITEAAYRYLQEKLDCYCIDLAAQFLPDESGFMRRSPSHTEDICYRLYHDIMLRIMRERPAQKEYCRVPGELRIEHLLRLSPDNPVPALALYFHSHPLDAVLLRLDREFIGQYRAQLAALLDTDGDSLPAVIAACPAVQETGPLAEELLRIGTALPAQPEKLPALRTAYRAYRPSEGIFSGRELPPVLPPERLDTPVLREAVRRGGEAVFSWEPVVGAAGYRVYRRPEGGKWQLLTESRTPAASFTEPAPASGAWRYTVRAWCRGETGKILSDFEKPGIALGEQPE